LVHYGWETTYGTATTASNKAFGDGLRATSLRRTNNVEELYTPGQRSAQKLIPKKYEGGISLEFALGNPWFFRAVMGTATVTGSGPYTHTFAETDTIPSITIENDVASDTASVAKLLGSKVATCNIAAAVGDIARVKLDLPFANESHGSTTSAKVAEAFDVYTFAHGSLELPNATTLAEVQNIDITIANSPEMIYGLGSRVGQKCPVKNRKYTSRVTLAFESSANLLEKLYGSAAGPVTTPAETATMELTFNNGLTGTNQRNIVMLFTGVQLDEHNLPQDPTAPILEDVV
jgi:hypothetical protein